VSSAKRLWEPTDGLPQAVRDRYVVRHKIEALLVVGTRIKP
jgi:hypothetical protein